MAVARVESLAPRYTITPAKHGYLLDGPRGAHYYLLRNVHRPHLLFPVNTRSHRGSLPVDLRGQWFTDSASQEG